MKTLRLLQAVSVVFATFLPLSAHAQKTDAPASAAPFQVSFWDSAQVIDRERSIHGVRLTLPYGSNRDIHGLDVGIANHTSGDVHGLQLSLGGYVEGELKGLQYNWLLAIAKEDVSGAQTAFYTSAGTLRGAQLGLVNRVVREAVGARLALVNVSETSTFGAEVGLVNYARSIKGLQLGVVNVTDGLHGVQLGLVNVAKNGFLPVFVIVNAAL
jgi:hypothetical protein